LLAKATEVLFDPVSTNWNFGDGSTSSVANATHRYSRAGSFVIEATVTYAVSYQISGESIWVESGSIAVSDSMSVVVSSNSGGAEPSTAPVNKVVRIVGKNCLEKPGTFGCDG
jgi:PKD repeat protein